MKNDVLRIALEYVTLRSRGDLSDARTIAHNALLDVLTAAGIVYEDREHAAQIAAELIARPETYEELTGRKFTASQRAVVALEIREMLKKDADDIQRTKNSWIASARKNFTPETNIPCKICGHYSKWTQAHHVIPLSRQFEMGYLHADHTVEYLCPTHHVILHVLLNQFHELAKDINARTSDDISTDNLSPQEINGLIEIGLVYFKHIHKLYRKTA